MASNPKSDPSRRPLTGFAAVFNRLPRGAKEFMRVQAQRIAELCRTGDEARPPAGKHQCSDTQVVCALASIGTAIWRIQSKLPRGGKANLPVELRNLPRYVLGAWDALAAAGIEVQDHKEQQYVPGMAVNVIAFQPIEGIESEVIHETIKPTVFYQNQLIQRADVIVARPLEAAENESMEALPTEGLTANR